MKLDRYKGHFFNWYDTEELLPLKPRYISSVDSGNPAGHLLTHARPLGLHSQPVFGVHAYEGLKSTVHIMPVFLVIRILWLPGKYSKGQIRRYMMALIR